MPGSLPAAAWEDKPGILRLLLREAVAKRWRGASAGLGSVASWRRGVGGGTPESEAVGQSATIAETVDLPFQEFPETLAGQGGIGFLTPLVRVIGKPVLRIGEEVAPLGKLIPRTLPEPVHGRQTGDWGPRTTPNRKKLSAIVSQESREPQLRNSASGSETPSRKPLSLIGTPETATRKPSSSITPPQLPTGSRVPQSALGRVPAGSRFPHSAPGRLPAGSPILQSACRRVPAGRTIPQLTLPRLPAGRTILQMRLPRLPGVDGRTPLPIPGLQIIGREPRLSSPGRRAEKWRERLLCSSLGKIARACIASLPTKSTDDAEAWEWGATRGGHPTRGRERELCAGMNTRHGCRRDDP